jgi:hypothetical protein
MTVNAAFHSNPDQREAFHRVIELVIRDLSRGKSRDEIVKDLVSRGSQPEHAAEFVDHIDDLITTYCGMTDFRRVVSRLFSGMIGLGAFWIIGGLIAGLVVGQQWGYGAVIAGIVELILGVGGRQRFQRAAPAR